MLRNNFPGIITRLKDGTPEIQAYIVDKCKQIFAKEPSYAGSTIGQIVRYHATSKVDALSLTGPS
jgi:hypothetical protein